MLQLLRGPLGAGGNESEMVVVDWGLDPPLVMLGGVPPYHPCPFCPVIIKSERESVSGRQSGEWYVGGGAGYRSSAARLVL